MSVDIPAFRSFGWYEKVVALFQEHNADNARLAVIESGRAPRKPQPSLAGKRVMPISPNAASTSNTLTNNLLRVAPWWIESPLSIDQIAADVTAAGDAGSKVRWTVYADNGFAYPGALLVDAGVSAADAVAAEAAAPAFTPTALSGLVWIGGAVQLAPSVQPTVRISNAWTPPVLIGGGTSPVAAGTTTIGYAMAGVSGAAPANFSSSIVTSGSVPRPIVRLA